MTQQTCDLPSDVVLVCGPPCAGKSTLVSQLARRGLDLVVDFDLIARELGSPVGWLHPQPYRDQAEARVRELTDALPGRGRGTAYVIRALAEPRARAIASRMIKARATWMINPGRVECLRRAEGRPAGTTDEINSWYARYAPWSGDHLTTVNR